MPQAANWFRPLSFCGERALPRATLYRADQQNRGRISEQGLSERAQDIVPQQPDILEGALVQFKQRLNPAAVGDSAGKASDRTGSLRDRAGEAGKGTGRGKIAGSHDLCFRGESPMSSVLDCRSTSCIYKTNALNADHH